MVSNAGSSLPALLQSLTASLNLAQQAAPEEASILPSSDGLSLLTTKNELFLSYVQNLVFLILVKLRHQRDDNSDVSSLNAAVVEKLAELRLLLEKGVKPLEGRLKYQVDKVIRASEDHARPAMNGNGSKPSVNGKSHPANREPHSGSDDSDMSGHDSDDSDEENELAYRPNPAALQKPKDAQAQQDARKDGIYRPPKITPTTLPVTMGKEEKAARRPARSAALDEFIAEDLSTAPMAEPSIGSTIRSGGRHTLSQREREEYAEKTRYEEENFTRLPRESKKEKAKRRIARGNTFGGEEWKNLGAGLDRIDRLTKRNSSSASILARSRKRDVQDGPRDSGEQPGLGKKRKVR